MAIKTILSGREWRHLPQVEVLHMATIKDEAERSAYEASEAAFLRLRIPSAKQMAVLKDLLHQGQYGSAVLYACRVGVVGWGNVRDDTGRSVAFKGIAERGCVIGASEEDIDCMPQHLREEAFVEITREGTLTARDFC